MPVLLTWVLMLHLQLSLSVCAIPQSRPSLRLARRFTLRKMVKPMFLPTQTSRLIPSSLSNTPTPQAKTLFRLISHSLLYLKTHNFLSRKLSVPPSLGYRPLSLMLPLFPDQITLMMLVLFLPRDGETATSRAGLRWEGILW